MALNEEELHLLERPLYLTPTWAVSVVCTGFVIVSLGAERSIHCLGNWLKRTKRKPLLHALEKIRDELMVLGFISLVLTVTQNYISQFCVDSSFYDRMPTPCKRESSSHEMEGSIHAAMLGNLNPRRQLNSRFGITCVHKGKEPFVSFESLEQLHRFIFVLGVTHVVYSCLTMLLALMKIYSWSSWENEAHAESHDSLSEITKTLTLRRQSTFVLYHTSSRWSRNKLLVWIVCFLRQFGQSVTRADYLTLRLGFITNHHTGTSYDFHSYMIRTVEDEFKEIVGISFPLWIFVIVFMLINVHGVNLYFWFAFLPVILVILVGAKLQHIIATLALENAGIRGRYIGQALKPRDNLFWFSKPELLLFLIHFVLFQNAFELATFLWTLWQFGYESCLMADQAYKKYIYVYARLISGVFAQFLCSYSTLPLYALVTQMGTNYKKTIFQESIVHSLNVWRKSAQQKARQAAAAEDSHSSDHDHDHDETVTGRHKVLKRSGYSSVGREEDAFVEEHPC
ncbi:hypothetical protein SELMODRAFT_77198 [Selaginella moellendorffii]|uniref:MLO-like protein n=1 Tax=Selaginella moellendorffii TaxID=88036 RepID=D8QRE4_SELML|nr:MLO-like protein 14 [Selaginella moellendorffii]EFJ37234.1 hypothetical protein SELMODRAFT_77198 [Selaginella moellendorffii]|eukprot:XP_002961974.1 MLO-like protein 14 [Selaginella moellendorffii]